MFSNMFNKKGQAEVKAANPEQEIAKIRQTVEDLGQALLNAFIRDAWFRGCNVKNIKLTNKDLDVNQPIVTVISKYKELPLTDAEKKSIEIYLELYGDLHKGIASQFSMGKIENSELHVLETVFDSLRDTCLSRDFGLDAEAAIKKPFFISIIELHKQIARRIWFIHHASEEIQKANINTRMLTDSFASLDAIKTKDDNFSDAKSLASTCLNNNKYVEECKKASESLNAELKTSYQDEKVTFENNFNSILKEEKALKKQIDTLNENYSLAKDKIETMDQKNYQVVLRDTSFLKEEEIASSVRRLTRQSEELAARRKNLLDLITKKTEIIEKKPLIVNVECKSGDEISLQKQTSQLSEFKSHLSAVENTIKGLEGLKNKSVTILDDKELLSTKDKMVLSSGKQGTGSDWSVVISEKLDQVLNTLLVINKSPKKGKSTIPSELFSQQVSKQIDKLITDTNKCVNEANKKCTNAEKVIQSIQEKNSALSKEIEAQKEAEQKKCLAMAKDEILQDLRSLKQKVEHRSGIPDDIESLENKLKILGTSRDDQAERFRAARLKEMAEKQKEKRLSMSRTDDNSESSVSDLRQSESSTTTPSSSRVAPAAVPPPQKHWLIRGLEAVGAFFKWIGHRLTCGYFSPKEPKPKVAPASSSKKPVAGGSTTVWFVQASQSPTIIIDNSSLDDGNPTLPSPPPGKQEMIAPVIEPDSPRAECWSRCR